jgi:cytochrome P450
MGEYTQKLPPGSYSHNVITQMKLDYDLPDVFYLDLWPAGPCMVVCTSPDACAISTTKNAFDMPAIVAKFFEGNAGASFIECTNGPLWKRLHKMLAPGLTPGAIKEHAGSILGHATRFHARLGDLAKAGEVVDLRSELGVYPFQVISSVLFSEALSSRAYDDAAKAAETTTAINAALNPLEKRRLRKELNLCFRRIEAEVEPKLVTRFAQLQQQRAASAKNSTMNLLDRMLLPQVESGQQLDSSLTRLILDKYEFFQSCRSSQADEFAD